MNREQGYLYLLLADQIDRTMKKMHGNDWREGKAPGWAKRFKEKGCPAADAESGDRLKALAKVGTMLNSLQRVE